MIACAILSRSVMSDSATLWTATCQAPLSLGIPQARILEWVASALLQENLSDPGIGLRDRTQVFCIAGRFFTIWAVREAQMQA